MARILPVLLLGHTCFFRAFPLGNCCFAPQDCGTFAAHRAGVWSVRHTVSAFPAVYTVRQVFRLWQVLLPPPAFHLPVCTHSGGGLHGHL